MAWATAIEHDSPARVRQRPTQPLLALSQFEVARREPELRFKTFTNESEVPRLRADEQIELLFEVIHQCGLAHASRAKDERVFSLRVQPLEPRDFLFSADERKHELANFV